MEGSILSVKMIGLFPHSDIKANCSFVRNCFVTLVISYRKGEGGSRGTFWRRSEEHPSERPIYADIILIY